MSDLDYDAQLTDDEREALGAVLWELDYDSDPRPDVFAAVERIILQARLLDLAQRAEADRAAVERVTALADEWERRGSILPANQLGKPHAPAMKQAVDRLRAALDPAPAPEGDTPERMSDAIPHASERMKSCANPDCPIHGDYLPNLRDPRADQ